MSKYTFMSQLLQWSTMAIVAISPVLQLQGQESPDTVIKLSEVVITDSAINRMIPRSVIPGDLLIKSSVADIGEILRNEPNISGIRRGGYAIDPVIRGFRYSQLNIYLDDGIHIEGGCPNRMDPILSHIEPELIEQLDIIRGPYLLNYGPSPSASVRIVTREENPYMNSKPRLIYITGYDANRKGIRQHLSLSGSVNKLYYRIGAGLKDFGNYTDGNGNEWESAFTKKDTYSDIGYQIKKGESVTLSYKGTFGRDVMFPALPMDEIKDNTQILSVRYAKQNLLIPDNNLQISAYRTGVYHEMDNRYRPQYSEIILPYTGLMQANAIVRTKTTGIRAEVHRKTGNFKINGGFDSELLQKDGTRQVRMIMQMDEQEFISEKKFNLWKEAIISNSGLFGGIVAERKKLSYSAAIRLDFNYSDSGDTLVIAENAKSFFEAKPTYKQMLSFSASASLRINQKSTLSLGLARGARAPDMQERYIKFLATGHDRYDYLGNPGLIPEINYQADLMYAHTSKTTKFYTDIFWSDVQNFITGTLLPPSVARPVSMGAPGVKQFNNIKRAVLCGFETGITAEFIEFLTTEFSAGYTYAYFPAIDKITLENGQASGTIKLKNDPIPEIPPLEAMFKASYQFYNGTLRPGISLRAVAAQYQTSDASYEESTPGYVLANIAVDYKPFSFVTFTTGVSNLFNKAYYDHLNRKLTGSADKLFEPGRTFYINLKVII